MAARRATGADALLALARLDGRRGAIAITTGVLADSIALVGFGIDSAIEGFASIIIVWRLSGWRLLSHAAEERAQKLVAIQFFLLAPYVTAEAIHTLGVGLTASSLIGMPVLGIAMHHLAEKLGSVATRGEGTQNLLCAYAAKAAARPADRSEQAYGLVVTPQSVAFAMITARTMQRMQKMIMPSSKLRLWRCIGPKTACRPRTMNRSRVAIRTSLAYVTGPPGPG